MDSTPTERTVEIENPPDGQETRRTRLITNASAATIGPHACRSPGSNPCRAARVVNGIKQVASWPSAGIAQRRSNKNPVRMKVTPTAAARSGNSFAVVATIAMLATATMPAATA